MEKIAWGWPEELDALIAAPRHHRLLYENEKVRVLATVIPPGERTEVHTHRWPASLYVISWSDFIRYDSEGDVMADSRQLSNAPGAGSALWTGSLVPHSLENIGASEINIISVEIKT